jgi:hypothetical protein
MSYAQININQNTLKYIFPYLKNKYLFNYLKIDNDSIHYISHKNISAKISSIIENHLSKYNINKKNAIITDCTAGVGGDSICLAQNFKFVYSIELNKTRYDYLNNNLSVYGIKNTKTYNKDFINIVPYINNHDIIFIDPPWGGSQYKSVNKIKIKISNVNDIEDICDEFLFSSKMKKNPLFIALKLPKNYDIHYLYTRLDKCNIYLYELDKMFIIIIEKKINNKLDKFINIFIKNILEYGINETKYILHNT